MLTAQQNAHQLPLQAAAGSTPALHRSIRRLLSPGTHPAGLMAKPAAGSQKRRCKVAAAFLAGIHDRSIRSIAPQLPSSVPRLAARLQEFVATVAAPSHLQIFDAINHFRRFRSSHTMTSSRTTFPNERCCGDE